MAIAPQPHSQDASGPLPGFARRARAERTTSPTLPRSSTELKRVADPDALASWAERALLLKNQLSALDSQALEAAFAGRLGRLYVARQATARSASETGGAGAKMKCLIPSSKLDSLGIFVRRVFGPGSPGLIQAETVCVHRDGERCSPTEIPRRG